MGNKVACIPIIDVFAGPGGPGGLGEGFAAYRVHGQRAFKIVLSIEMDEIAHRTLELRSYFRQFSKLADVPDAYYRFLQNPERTELERETLLNCDAGEAARKEVWKATLGTEPLVNVRKKIEGVLPTGKEPWVLIGGPPCQAYSMVGRARNKAIKNYRLEDDPKHGLYKHYLQIIADYRPAVFVMENVKGLLSARADGELVFQRMRSDLQHPAAAISNGGNKLLHSNNDEYRICSLSVAPDTGKSYAVSDFVIRSEEYGVPQARHRVFLIGIRNDFASQGYKLLQTISDVSIAKVLRDLPRVRSGVSRGKDSNDAWRAAMESAPSKRWFCHAYAFPNASANGHR